MNRVFAALADGNRRRMLDVLKASPGCTVGDVCAVFERKMSRIGALKHLKVLERAGLVESKQDGRSRRLYLNAVPIQLIHDRWTTEFSALWSSGLARLKYALEGDEK